MQFDVSKVYSAVNATDLKVGSKIIVADTLAELKRCVENELSLSSLIKIRGESYESRFVTDNSTWALAYLVSELEEKKLKWTDLKVGDVITNGDMECMVVTIDKRPNAFFRICVITPNGLDWLSLSIDGVKDWEKVEK